MTGPEDFDVGIFSRVFGWLLARFGIDASQASAVATEKRMREKAARAKAERQKQQQKV